ncbi:MULTISPECIES: iron response transcriptional regulator IrrA [Thalassospira]|jgi:Fur family iron response transcriptional regulator|uniref:Ferric uptake regulation protein n=2 Tax=Thalassospira TaxID=168934 RepID=A0A367WGU5_9PROT|nr:MULTISPECIES: Fur family transcriptional regulator [Thalassospira]MDG4718720.1 Fur family transcriptional regulator [Thalassospira sp. FZY0004]RCK39702.1 Fur family transcriptional regulator [Thalassospira profundimaris]
MRTTSRPYTDALNRLKDANLRPTRQRLALARLLFENGHRHVTAEQLHSEAMTNSIKVSLATVYNTLHQFTDAGLLTEIVIDPGRSYFDTNTAPHYHFYCEEDGLLSDIPADTVQIDGIPNMPSGTELASVDLVFRLRRNCSAQNAA